MLVGVRQQDMYVHQSGDGQSFADHMAQSMEHWVKLMKRHLCNNCNSRNDGKINKRWRVRLMNFMDCFTIGSSKYNLVDYKHCVLRYLKSTELIYEPTTTPMLESHLLCGMPDTWFELYTKVNKIQFGDRIDPELSQICNRHLTANQQIHALRIHIDNNFDVSVFDMMDDTSSWDEDLEGPLNDQLQTTNNISKTKLLQLLQQDYK